MERQPIETAPKDGTWVMLFGGVCIDEEGQTPVAVARWLTVPGKWSDWIVAYAEAGFNCTTYDNPTEWAPLPRTD
tara:strand:+ start:1776 stop:2000 length:225 start_codon:yes stop_codon:yes gene_type:complete